MNNDIKKFQYKYDTLPFIPVEIIFYPSVLLPIHLVLDQTSIASMDKSLTDQTPIIFITKNYNYKDYPTLYNIFPIGTICKIKHLIRLGNGTYKLIVQGCQTCKILSINKNTYFYEANIELINDVTIGSDMDIYIQQLLKRLYMYIKLKPALHKDLKQVLQYQSTYQQVIYTIANSLALNLFQQYKLLTLNTCNEQVVLLMKFIEKEINKLYIENNINNNVKKQLAKNHREYYLNEQMKYIKNELKQINPRYQDEHSLLKKKIISCGMSKEALSKALSELNKLKFMPSLSAEATVTRAYLEWLIKLPWRNFTPVKIDLNYAKSILDQNHFGLVEVKERILEYLAGQSRNAKLSGPIICLVGAPGVGKTSLGQSIAKALGRKYVRISLGGLHDEAEIRGHRRTYIGALPGRIIQKLSKIKVINPVFLLDEIDKISSNNQVRGDPEYALLEVLDPEQNTNFSDNYLEVDFDLSHIMFIATANSLNISHVLRDRMEIIKVNGYTENEKIHITQKYLKKKYNKNYRLYNKEIVLNKEVIANIIRCYTMEAGLRELERNIDKIYRKALKTIMINKQVTKIEINKKNISNYLGIAKYDFKHTKTNPIGQVNGLAWTESGGDTLLIEAAFVEGKGALIYTGSLGKIMQESIKLALTVVRLYAKKFKIHTEFYNKYDIHVHVTEGSIPKDGPSAGIAICTALVSSLTNNPIKTNIAMTGEITLFGQILPIGGLREKLLAASRTKHINHIIIPKANVKDLVNIPYEIKSKFKISLVNQIEQVLEYSLVNYPY